MSSECKCKVINLLDQMMIVIKMKNSFTSVKTIVAAESYNKKIGGKSPSDAVENGSITQCILS